MRARALVLLALLVCGCPSAPSDPPPPTRKPEIPTAPPHALGALAAGTDAAPRPDTTPSLEGDSAVPPPAPPVAAPDGGVPDPGSEPAPKPAPDAGMAL
jgi:hypothetical protein